MSQKRELALENVEEEITRVREARRHISERFGHDPYKLVAYYMERQCEHRDRLVSYASELASVPEAAES